MRLKDKVAIVTGAGSGIGEAIAKKFLEEGAKVCFADINDDIEKINLENAIGTKCNVSKYEEVAAAVETTVKKFGTLDIIVNNAGIAIEGNAINTSVEDWQKLMNINLNGVFFGVKAAATYMKNKRIQGSIINMASILGAVGFERTVAYCASKGGVIQITKSSAIDFAKDKIRVNAIAPGFIKTNMTKGNLGNPIINHILKSRTPMGYIGSPEDIAFAAVYLASEESKYVTGNVLFVDGGWRAQ